MTTTELKNRLIELENINASFSDLLKNFSFATKKEADDYVNNNKDKFELLEQTRKEIQDIKWQLMSDKEKKAHTEEWKQITEKHEGE